MVERQLGPQVAVSGKSRSSSLAYEPTDLRYQRTLPAALALAFDMQSVRMAGDNAWLSSTFDIFVAHADDDDDTGAFSQPEGW